MKKTFNIKCTMEERWIDSFLSMGSVLLFTSRSNYDRHSIKHKTIYTTHLFLFFLGK